MRASIQSPVDGDAMEAADAIFAPRSRPGRLTIQTAGGSSRASFARVFCLSRSLCGGLRHYDGRHAVGRARWQIIDLTDYVKIHIARHGDVGSVLLAFKRNRK